MSLKDLLRLIQPNKKTVAIKPDSVIMVNESNIDYSELGKRLSLNRSKLGRGHGKSYWKSQGRIAVDYLREVSKK